MRLTQKKTEENVEGDGGNNAVAAAAAAAAGTAAAAAAKVGHAGGMCRWWLEAAVINQPGRRP